MFELHFDCPSSRFTHFACTEAIRLLYLTMYLQNCLSGRDRHTDKRLEKRRRILQLRNFLCSELSSLTAVRIYWIGLGISDTSFCQESQCATPSALYIHIYNIYIGRSKGGRVPSGKDSAPNCRGLIIRFSASPGMVKGLFRMKSPFRHILSFSANVSLLRSSLGSCCPHGPSTYSPAIFLFALESQ